MPVNDWVYSLRTGFPGRTTIPSPTVRSSGGSSLASRAARTLDTQDLRIQHVTTYPGGGASYSNEGGPRINIIAVNGQTLFQAPPVPEPSTLVLAAIGDTLLAGRRLKRIAGRC